MKYRITWSRRATRSLRGLETATRRRVVDKVRNLADDPRPPDCESVRGYPYFRVRVGDYRIVYDVQDDEVRVSIVLVGHRREIYQQMNRL